VRHFVCFLFALLAYGCGAVLVAAQQPPTARQEGIQQQEERNMTTEQRASATRAFLGLGAVPDRIAAARGVPLYTKNCAFCHGRNGRGATGPSLITSDVVLGDDHGERLIPFLKKGRPDKGMPAFARIPDPQLKNVAELLHQQIEDVANRGAYRVLNILVGNPAKGKAYVEGHCTSCHKPDTFDHIASKFRSPELLQRGWVWPSGSARMTAEIRSSGGLISGELTQISDFRITLVDASGRMHAIVRGPAVEVQIKDQLAAHEEIVKTLANDDMHNVTAYLETLK